MITNKELMQSAVDLMYELCTKEKDARGGALCPEYLEECLDRGNKMGVDCTFEQLLDFQWFRDCYNRANTDYYIYALKVLARLYLKKPLTKTVRIKGKHNSAVVFTTNIDARTKEQIETIVNLPAFEGSKIRIMPDCHAGAGCVIGTTMTITDKICPNLVGVDIGCGVLAINLREREIDFKKLDTVIRENIPYGFAVHKTPPSERYKSLECRRCMTPLCFEDNADKEREIFSRTIGSLGGGNHFIEIDRDEYNNLWLLIHSGSRNPGLRVAEFYQKLAQEKDPDAPKDLACLSGEDAKNYLHDMRTMQTFAHLNRLAIATIILENMGLSTLEKIETAHNYIGADNVLRKGAVSACSNEKFVLPLNMRDGALICIGRGNQEWNCSAPHGAGRIMSRAEAKKSLKLKEFRQQMEGIYSTCISNNTIDESPMAYKDSKEIISNTCDTILCFKETLRPLYNFKAE